MMFELLVSLCALISWLFLHRYLKIPSASVTFISGYLYLFIVLFPSIFIASGDAIRTILGQSVPHKPLVFVIALMGFGVFILSVVYAHFLSSGVVVVCNPRSKFFLGLRSIHFIYFFFLFVIILFAVGAFNNIPLLMLLKQEPLRDVLLKRADYREQFQIDQLFLMLTLLFFYLALSLPKDQNIKNKKYVLIFLLLLLVFFVFARLGRDDFLPIIIGFMIFNSKGGKFPALAIFVIILLLFLLWYLFTPYNSTILESINNIFERVLTQTLYVYFHLDHVPSSGLLDRGVGVWWGNGENFNPSKAVFDDFYGRSGGSTAGYSIAKLWYVFSWSSLLISFLMFSFLIWIDFIFFRSMQFSFGSPGLKALHGLFASVCLIPMVFNLTSFFSLEHIFSLKIYGLFLLVWFFLPIRFIRRKKI